MPRTGCQTLICIPTLNERENISALIDSIFEVRSDLDVLVIDDNSPDGTSNVVRKLAMSDCRVQLLLRPRAEGIGRAYMAAFDYAIAAGYENLVQIDADFSHNPSFIPAMLEALADADLVIGSRRVPGGGSSNWSMIRNTVSFAGTLWARQMLDLELRDLTAGFNAIRVSTLPRIDYHTLGASGFVFQIELKYRMVSGGARVKEIPIVFEGRRAGRSKLSPQILTEALWWVWKHRQR